MTSWVLFIWIAGIVVGIIWTGVDAANIARGSEAHEHIITSGIAMSIFWPFMLAIVIIAAPFWVLLRLGDFIGNKKYKTFSFRSKKKKKNKEVEYKRRIARLEAQLIEQKTKLAGLKGYRQ